MDQLTEQNKTLKRKQEELIDSLKNLRVENTQLQRTQLQLGNNFQRIENKYVKQNETLQQKIHILERETRTPSIIRVSTGIFEKPVPSQWSDFPGAVGKITLSSSISSWMVVIMGNWTRANGTISFRLQLSGLDMQEEIYLPSVKGAVKYFYRDASQLPTTVFNGTIKNHPCQVKVQLQVNPTINSYKRQADLGQVTIHFW
ncbi:bhlh transcription factor [Anaeramoeba flamelloides]|uniref:Bhlh transcription factor n=1 Tax=Anaeramoeba flamelloides TaxID=1746091 RepID=A0AAV7ZMX9_9EUKA|nr:bhlh transcription factor [Anaeramoeba flamelloides]